MGLGLTREKLGDILFPEKGRCQVAVLRRPCPSSCPSGRGPGGGKSPWGRSRCMSCARPRPP
ncbi:MAG: hypothetical protein V8S34_02875 [Lawsonibacter sp.]